MRGALFLLCLSVIAPNIVGELAKPRGTPISKASLYAPREDFTCLDGSATIPYNRINDDYCDCADASDEPGTSACLNGLFHCTNPGFRPKNIPSAWVNDGVCDCCDGTDEFDGVQCENNCKELGKVMREEADRQAELLKEGHAIYQEYVQQGQVAKKEKRERQVQLEKDRDEMEMQRKDLETFKEEAEKPETVAKELHKKAWEDEKERIIIEETREKAEHAFKQLDVNQDSLITMDEIQLHREFDIDSSGEVSIEEAKEYLEDNGQVDSTLFLEKIWPNIKEIYVDHAEPVATGDVQQEEQVVVPAEPKPPALEHPEFPEVTEGYPEGTEEDDDEGGNEDDDHDDEVDDDEDSDDDDDHDDEDGDDVPPDPHQLGDDSQSVEDPTAPKEEGKTEEQLPDYDDATKLIIEAADKARSEFNEVDRQFKEMDSEINEIKKFLEIDMGPNLEFYPLKGQCFDYKDREYIYQLCPFERASQRNKHGGTEANLGSWGHWAGGADNIYSAMKYENGQNCWNGPDRSVKVLISCGKNNEVLSASEPNRCEYEFKFSTPAACSKPPKNADDKPRDEL